MHKVFQIQTITSQETVSLLESLLEKARKGKITGIAAAGLGRRRTLCFALGGTAWDDQLRAIGALRLLEDELVKKSREP